GAPRADGARIEEREVWERLAGTREAAAFVKKAEAILEEPVPEVTDELFLEFRLTGDRGRYEKPFFARTDNLAALRVAECLEAKGRFIPKIAEYLDAICAERTWVAPAHDETLAAFNGANKIDLFAAMRAFELAQTLDWLKGRLPDATVRKTKEECVRRVFAPYLHLARNFEDDAKRSEVEPNRRWFDGKWNWNSVCHSCVVRSALALVEDARERAEFIAAAEYAVPFALEGYFDDGYCAEGVGYWNYGFAHHVELGLAVRNVTDGFVDFFSAPKNRLIAEYARRIELCDGMGPQFSDSFGGPSLALRALVNQVYPDLYREEAAECPVLSVDGNIGQPLSLAAFRLRDSCAQPSDGGVAASPALQLRNYFGEAQVFVARSAPCGFALAVTGGHNDMPHNHNDIGSYALVLDGAEMGGDPGREPYTERTFSPLRYESRVINSYGHPVPVVDGRLQGTGRQFAAKVLKTEFNDGKDEIIYDLTRAYPECSLEKLTRRVVIDRARNRIVIEDEAEFSRPSAFEVPFVTYLAAESETSNGAEGAMRFSFAHPSDGRAMILDVAASAPLVFRDEIIANPGRQSYRRMGFSFANLAAKAKISMTFSIAPGTGEARLENALDGIFAAAAAHYTELDAAASKLCPDAAGRTVIPHGFDRKTRILDMKDLEWWTVGHYPGTLWYLYEATGDDFFKDRAIHWTELLEPCKDITFNHDIGFMIYCSFGNARRLLGTDKYDAIILTAADSLSKRYHEGLGLIRSWGKIDENKDFLVIPDNLMNLEMLEWASKAKGGDRRFDRIARSHADVTMKRHYRPDGGAYHVLNYSSADGRVQEIRRKQGASCFTAWSRGQAWTIYGYTMMFRETGKKDYLDFAVKAADYAIDHPDMPADGVPYWDFGAPGEERDTAAAAVMASGFLELSQYAEHGGKYRAFAVKQLLSLASPDYFSQGDEAGHWLLKHGVGSKPDGVEIDTPLDYTDYYFLEALLRFKKLKEDGKL
ncbi:MAG: glycoside hydrolase family 88 protein, partial [Kiritimatiellae bacterium]|nr:glycoside hydrolase family 88 protein [Kiritimatiellia bacterium]